MATGRRVPLVRVTFVLLLIAVAAAGSLGLSRTPMAESAGAILNFPSTDCGSNQTQIHFRWVPVSGAQEQWLDISLKDNHFLPGTYSGEKLELGQRQYSTVALSDDEPHYWRINSRTTDGWVSSKTGVFVPCGGPQLLWGPTICQSAEFASVHFRWAPRADAFGNQWLEVTQDVSFNRDVTRIGPLAASTDDFRRGGFEVGKRTYFRVAWEDSDGNRVVTKKASFVPDCSTPSITSALYPSADRLAVPRLGIDAPVNVRDVGYNGYLGVPAGAYDVVRYNFAAQGNLRGYPGDGGVTLIGGHVDYYSVGLAVFAPLRSARTGDVIEYERGDGVTIRYEVDWVADLPFDESLNGYLVNRGTDEMILVTCNGTFDRAAGRYDLRRLVHAVRTN